MIKAVLFDYFGVLHPDTFWGLADVFVPNRDQQKKQAMRDLIRRVDLGMIDQKEFWTGAAEVFETNVDELMKTKEKLGGIDQRLMEIIKQLKQKDMKTGILSNVGVGFMERAFRDYDTDDYFDEFILSGEVGVIKPDKRIYDIAAERLGLKPEECLFFDDINRNVEGARLAGMSSELYEGIESCKSALRAAGIQIQ